VHQHAARRHQVEGACRDLDTQKRVARRTRLAGLTRPAICVEHRNADCPGGQVSGDRQLAAALADRLLEVGRRRITVGSDMRDADVELSCKLAQGSEEIRGLPDERDTKPVEGASPLEQRECLGDDLARVPDACHGVHDRDFGMLRELKHLVVIAVAYHHCINRGTQYRGGVCDWLPLRQRERKVDPVCAQIVDGRIESQPGAECGTIKYRRNPEPAFRWAMPMEVVYEMTTS
jgi:hypothetical protein